MEDIGKEDRCDRPVTNSYPWDKRKEKAEKIFKKSGKDGNRGKGGVWKEGEAERDGGVEIQVKMTGAMDHKRSVHE
jgi:hypothetical protein